MHALSHNIPRGFEAELLVVIERAAVWLLVLGALFSL